MKNSLNKIKCETLRIGITHPAPLENVIGVRKTSARTVTPHEASMEPGKEEQDKLQLDCI